MWRKKALVAMSGCGAVLLASAANAECNNYICEDVKILTMVTNADGNVLVRTAGTTANLGCALESGIYMTLKSSSARFKEIYANLLAFQVADRPISIRVDIGVAGCPIAYIYGSTP
jgi:hypothetical protein